jgi:hypothetical protein
LSLVNLPISDGSPVEQSIEDTELITPSKFVKTHGLSFYSLKSVPIITVSSPVLRSRMLSIYRAFC